MATAEREGKRTQILPHPKHIGAFDGSQNNSLSPQESDTSTVEDILTASLLISEGSIMPSSEQRFWQEFGTIENSTMQFAVHPVPHKVLACNNENNSLRIEQRDLGAKVHQQVDVLITEDQFRDQSVMDSLIDTISDATPLGADNEPRFEEKLYARDSRTHRWYPIYTAIDSGADWSIIAESEAELYGSRRRTLPLSQQESEVKERVMETLYYANGQPFTSLDKFPMTIQKRWSGKYWRATKILVQVVPDDEFPPGSVALHLGKDVIRRWKLQLQH